MSTITDTAAMSSRAMTEPAMSATTRAEITMLRSAGWSQEWLDGYAAWVTEQEKLAAEGKLDGEPAWWRAGFVGR